MQTALQSFKTKFIGDRDFYKRVLAVTVPIMIQTGITNFVSFLDNIMVGRVGTEQMSGVAIVNQLIFVFYLAIFGGFAGAGIFTAQFYGKNDHEGIRHTFRYKLIMGIFLLAVAISILKLRGDALIGLYLRGDPGAGDAAATLGYAKDYLDILVIGLPAFMLVQAYTNTLRECSQTVVPMKAGVVAVFVNLVLNWLLIYGKLGFPVLGVRGAAIATVIARYSELLMVAVWAHTHIDECPYLKAVYRRLSLPWSLFKKIVITGTPLLVNEVLWSSGMAAITQCYSERGLAAVAACNIHGVVSNVFNVVFFAMGDAVAIIVGQHLGAGDMERARDDDNKIIAFAVMIAVCVGIAIALTSPLFPRLYNTSDEVRSLATRLLLAQALFSPQIAFLHTAYFTVRAGGRTMVTFFFDSVFMWIVSVPLLYFLSRYTQIGVIMLFVFSQMAEWIKCFIGFILVKNGSWMRNIVR